MSQKEVIDGLTLEDIANGRNNWPLYTTEISPTKGRSIFVVDSLTPSFHNTVDGVQFPASNLLVVSPGTPGKGRGSRGAGEQLKYFQKG